MNFRVRLACLLIVLEELWQCSQCGNWSTEPVQVCSGCS